MNGGTSVSVHYVRVECACGHHAMIGTSRWLHRDELLRRARCSVCGKLGAVSMSLNVVAVGMGRSIEEQLADLEGVRIFTV